MRILHVTDRFDFGGTENYVRELVNIQSQRKEVILFAPKGRQLPLLSRYVTFIPFYRFHKFLFFHILWLLYIIWRHKPKVIHAHKRFSILSASIAGMLAGVPVVATVHGRIRFDLRSRLARRKTARLIFVSRRVLEVSRYHPELAHKSVIIPNGTFPYEQIPEIIPYGIAYISRLDKRHATFIEMLFSVIPRMKVRFPAMTLWLVGDGERFLSLSKAAEKINKEAGAQVIEMKGYVESISCFTRFPELVLGTGRVAVEALMNQRLVIPVNINRFGSLVTSENLSYYQENNFVPVNGLPPDKESLEREIIRFFDQRETMLSENLPVVKKIQAECDITVVSQKIEQIYAQVIHQSRR